MSRYAISDIHGCAKTFEYLLDALSVQKGDELFLLGDYIDRGPDSKGVIDLIFQLKKEGLNVHCLMGNHEKLLLDGLQDKTNLPIWFLNGGEATLQSFGISRVEQMEERYFEFFGSLDHYVETEGYILAHAGLNFKVEDPLSDETALLWIRGWYDQIDKDWLDGRLVVHGHTPTTREQLERQFEKSREIGAINIDAGCVYKGIREGTGFLCALDLDDRKLIFVENAE
ncbi:MAG: metallophosphoesterase family protein [Saprospiraceae bacterium]|nr:metallophosphoesterase family protein [Saprospiraceae bacterium]